MKLIRERHLKIVKLLEQMDSDALQSMDCFFGGGTAVSLLTNEYRLSTDVDFMCATNSGYKELREAVFGGSLNKLFRNGSPKLLREVRADRDGIRAIIDLEGEPLKFEIVLESRIKLDSAHTELPVPTLSKNSLFAEKLLANADRGLDKAGLSKDMFDLIIMQHYWGSIPLEPLKTTKDIYGMTVAECYLKVFNMLKSNTSYLNDCLQQLDIDKESFQIIKTYLTNPLNGMTVMHHFDGMDIHARPKY